MQQYKGLSGKSGINKYESGADFIIILFNSGGYYKYTYGSAGKGPVEHMKKLAEQGIGLHTFISTKATQPPFAKKGNSLQDVL
jgi:hypothetical protein